MGCTCACVFVCVCVNNLHVNCTSANVSLLADVICMCEGVYMCIHIYPCIVVCVHVCMNVQTGSHMVFTYSFACVFITLFIKYT